jgi:hypothetical protein
VGAGGRDSNQQLFSRDGVHETALDDVTVRESRKAGDLVTLDE